MSSIESVLSHLNEFYAFSEGSDFSFLNVLFSLSYSEIVGMVSTLYGCFGRKDSLNEVVGMLKFAVTSKLYLPSDSSPSDCS